MAELSLPLSLSLSLGILIQRGNNNDRVAITLEYLLTASLLLEVSYCYTVGRGRIVRGAVEEESE